MFCSHSDTCRERAHHHGCKSVSKLKLVFVGTVPYPLSALSLHRFHGLCWAASLNRPRRTAPLPFSDLPRACCWLVFLGTVVRFHMHSYTRTHMYERTHMRKCMRTCKFVHGDACERAHTCERARAGGTCECALADTLTSSNFARSVCVFVGRKSLPSCAKCFSAQ